MLYLHSMGHFYPENIITNKFLEDLDIGTSEAWILERVGIQNRRTILPLDYIKETKNANRLAAPEAALYNHTKMAALAAKMALSRASLKIEDIGMLIAGTSTPDNVAPAEAAAIATQLGIEVPCFDMNSACSTFGMQINFLSKLQPGTLPSYIMIVNAETMTKTVDYSDRSMAVLFGDGCSVAIVSTDVPARAQFTGCHYGSRPSAWDKVGIKHDWLFYQDGHAVQGFAIRATTDGVKLLQKALPTTAKRFIFVGHQANMGMLQTVCERTGIAPDNHWYNVDQRGNTASCGAPGTLSMHWDEIQNGDYIALSIVGAGLSWAHIMLKVEENK
jgi:3-oxoacyl-[acyl-carrier-protein] synthase III